MAAEHHEENAPQSLRTLPCRYSKTIVGAPSPKHPQDLIMGKGLMQVNCMRLPPIIVGAFVGFRFSGCGFPWASQCGIPSRSATSETTLGLVKFSLHITLPDYIQISITSLTPCRLLKDLHCRDIQRDVLIRSPSS